ncbi:MAG: YihY/virulence factor BrkB family protein [Bradymonadia bacterium]
MSWRDLKARLRARRAALKVYFNDTIWVPLPPDAPNWARAQRRLARFSWLGAQRLSDGEIFSRSASLTFHVLLSIVPLLAVAFSLSKGFGLEMQSLREMLKQLFVGHEEIVDQLLNYVNRTDVRALGTVGLLILVYSAVSLLGRIEGSFNKIWGVKRNRHFVRKFADYLSVILIFPLLMFAATTITASVGSTDVGVWLKDSAITSVLVGLLPFVIVWAAFTFIYVFMPNTRVNLKAGMIGALVAAVVWSIAQWGYIYFQMGVSRYNAIYGTFAALPIFLVWLNLSWTIVLLGCEIAFIVQHEKSYHPRRHDAPPLSIAAQEKMALFFVSHVWQRFSDGEPAYSAGALAAEADLRMSDCLEIVEGLTLAGLLTWAREPEEGLMPARDLGALSVGQILVLYRQRGGAEDGEVGPELATAYAEIDAAIESGLAAELAALKG